MKKFYLTVLTALCFLSMYSQLNDENESLKKAKSFLSNTKISFEENKGQITGEDASKVKYTLKKGGLSVFLMDNGIAYQFNKTHYPEGYERLDKFTSAEEQKKQDELESQIRIETYRMDLTLLGANTNAKITEEGESKDYVQYYNHDALNVRSYSKITYHDIYPNIDWVIYQKGEDLKYDFIVRPGGNPNIIQIKTNSVEDLHLNKDGSLELTNRMGSITEQSPISFQGDKEINTQFILKENIISFNVTNYNVKETLIIDPLVRIWGTYYGGTGSESAYSCSVDASGNVYLAGSASSTSGIAIGGHQNTIGGFNDAFLVKFNSSGVRQWATYYGGTSGDIAWSCTADASGNVYLAGYSGSTGGISSGGHQNTKGGLNDAFLVKFNSSGVRQWGTYYGGTSNDYGFPCLVDASGNVYLAGRSTSTNGIASGGHQNTSGGSQDAFLVKFNSSGVRQWGTYYGGTGSDEGQSCLLDGSGNIYLAGSTSSTSGIASGGHQNTIGGSSDAFLVKFNSSGVRQWGTYYGGTSLDRGTTCSVDVSGNIYLGGDSRSTTGIASGGHQNTIGGGLQDAFLVKFNSSGVRQWGTYYGGTGTEYGKLCSVDVSGNVFLSGSTNSANGIASGGHQNTIGGGDDAFLVKFNSSGVRQWGTYYGGTGTDYGQSCSVDASGNVYLAGNAPSTSGIASGGHQNTYGGGSNDAFLVKFSECLTANNTTTTTSICENQTKALSATPSGGTWSVISGGGTISGTTYTPADVTVNTPVTVRYTIAANGGCSASTSDAIFTVNVLEVANNTTTTAAICENQTKALSANPSGGTWSVISGGGTISGTTYTPANVTVNTPVTVRYTIAANGGCSASTSDSTFTVNVLEVANNTTTTAAICENQTKALSGTPSGGTWSVISGGGTISGTTYTPADVTVNTPVTVRYTIAANGGCSASTSDSTFTVNVSEVANNTTTTAAICENQTKALSGTPSGGTWSVISGGGTISGTTYTPANVTVNTPVTVRYTIAANGGCSASTSDSTFTVNVSEIASNTTTTTAICESQTKALVGSPSGGTWSVISGGGTILGTTYTPANVTANTPVTVRYTIVANGGCSASTSDSTFTVNVLEVANNTTTTAAICENQTKALSGTPSGGTWSVISGGGTISGTTYTPADVTVNTPVTVRYTIAANGGCSASTSDSTFTVNVSEVANNTTTTAAICENQTKALSGTPSGGTWSVISGGGTISGTTYTPANVTVNTPVTVRYTIAANGGCSASTSDSTFTVNVSEIASNTTTTTAICESQTKALVGSPSGGTWSVISGGGTILGTTYTPANVTANTPVTVRYTIAANGGCSASTSDSTFTVNVLEVANNTTTTAAICENQTKALSGTPSGGTWSVISGGGTISGTTYTPANVTVNTPVTVRYTIAANGGCSASTSDSTFTVEPFYSASITSSNANMCPGDKRELQGTITNGIFTVLSGPGIIGVNDTLTANGKGTIQIEYSYTNSCGTVNTTQSITVGSTTPVNITNSTAPICEGSKVALTATPIGGTWSVISGSGNIGIGDSLFANVSGNSQVMYSAITSCGSESDTVNILINPLPSANAGVDENICLGDNIAITASGGVSYLWSTGGMTPTIQVSPVVTTTYDVTVSSPNGCSAIDSLTVFVQTPSNAVAQNDESTVTTGELSSINVYVNDIGSSSSIQIIGGPSNGIAGVTSSGIINYISNTSYVGLDSLQYTICDVNCGSACDTATLFISVGFDINISSGLSPNNDGINDEFRILGLNKYPDNELLIYNRWGSMVFKAKPYNNDWKGQTDNALLGSEVIEGTYFYILKLDNDTPAYKGYIELKK